MDPLQLAALFLVASTFPSLLAIEPFKVIDPAFTNLLGPEPKVIELAHSDNQQFHEGAVYHHETSLWVVADDVKGGKGSIQRITGLDTAATTKIETINSSIPTPIGGFRYIPDTVLGDVILFAGQCGMDDSQPGGIYALNPYPPYNSPLLLGGCGSYPYNAPDDVTVTSDGVIWLTDPTYGYFEGNRPLPILPNQVYSFNPLTQDVRVVADGFDRPNCIAASADKSTIYIGDTGAQVGNGTIDFQGPRTVYAYDRNGKFLSNRRVLAMPNMAGGGVDGIKTDRPGNVLA